MAAFEGIEQRDEVARNRLRRDTRRLGERALEALRTLPATFIVFFLLVSTVYYLPGFFDIALIAGGIFSIIPLTKKPPVPFRKRRSLHELDHRDIPPGRVKPQMSRGIFFLGNRIGDDAEIWGGNEDLRTHAFVLGSTGAGKTEALIGMVWNTLVMASGVVYVDGKADVKLWGQFFSMARQMGREDDVRVINYMTGNADTTRKRASKLSNSYNPFTRGNAESNTQLIVDLLDASGSGGDMWKGRAISFISSLMPPLHELRDEGYLRLDIGQIRDHMPPARYFTLLDHPAISERSRAGMMAFLTTVPGYKPGKDAAGQSAGFLDQYGFQMMQFTRILGSLAVTYGHIYGSDAGEVDFRDVVLNRRILLVLLPALSVSRPELANLGKIIVASLKNMMGSELGGKLEGSKRDLLDSRSTNAPMPFAAFFDEFGYFMPDGAALMWAQARGLGFALIAAGQDLQAFYRTSKEETLAIVSNCNLKIVGKLEDPDATFDLVKKMGGQATVTEGEGYEQQADGLGSFQNRLGARLNTVDRVSLKDLKDQVEGEVHIFVKSDIIRARTFYPGPRLTKEFRINHFVKVHPMGAEELAERRLDVRGLVESLTIEPFAEVTPPKDFVSAIAAALTHPRYVKYSSAHQGAERGITMLWLLADEAFVAKAYESTSGEVASGSGCGALAVASSTDAVLASSSSESSKPVEIDAVDALGSMLATGPSELALAAPVSSVLTVDSIDATEMFDGAALRSTNVFESSVAESLATRMSIIAEAAFPLIASLFDLGAVDDGSSAASAGGETEAGSLDRGETSVRLGRVALGLGASETEAVRIAEHVVREATEGTEYPSPPKPASTPDKHVTMESVMLDLEELMDGSAPMGGSR